MICEDYAVATTVEEALASLASFRGEGRIIAGGTDLVIQLQAGERRTRGLVDISRIPGLSDIRSDGSYTVVGAAATFAQIERSELIQHGASALAEAAAQMGSPQIRNVATLAGNVVNAMPAADGSIALLALDAEAEIVNLTGRQWVKLDALFVSPGVSRVDATGEIVAALRFRRPAMRQASAFERLARRKAMSLPLINVAVSVLLDAEGTRVREARIAIGPVAPVPFRAKQAEALLVSQTISEELLGAAADMALRESQPRSSALRASAEYRRELVRVLTRRALDRAIQRARG